MKISQKAIDYIAQNADAISARMAKLSKKVEDINPIRQTKNITNPISQLKKDTVELSQEALFGKRLLTHYEQSPIKISLAGKEGNWTKYSGSQMGSQDAFWARNNETGEIYYIKFAQNKAKEGHIASEIQANNLYKLAGVETPEVVPVTINGVTKGLASKYIPDLKDATTDLKQLRKGFAADAWLANWDSLLYGNTFIKDGKMYKIDNGGALKYRAMGELKPNFGDTVDEIITLVDGRNFESTSIYSKLTHEELVESFKKVCKISDKSIKETVDDPKLAQTLINRKNYMKKFLAEIEKSPRKDENIQTYFSNIAKRISSQTNFDQENILSSLSKFVSSKIKNGYMGVTLPSTKTILKDLSAELKQLEKDGVKISEDDIIKLLQEVASEGINFKVPSKCNASYQIFEMEEQYNKMFKTLLNIANKTPKKETESGSAYFTRLIKAREKRIKQLDDFRIKNIKSKLKYAPDKPYEIPTLSEKHRQEAIKALQDERERDFQIEVMPIPLVTGKSTDKEICEAWQQAHLGGFNFKNSELEEAVMSLAGRYNSKHPIKTKTQFETIAQKNYKQDFENEPVYHWFESVAPEDFVNRQIPKTGEIYTLKRQQCCSTHKEYGEIEFGDHMPNQNIKFIMHPKSETSRAYNVGYNQEVVYPKGEQFKILDKEYIEYIDPKTGNGKMVWEIHMQEV